jgi:hypothetical protein
MNTEDWICDSDSHYLTSKSSIQVPWLKQSLEVWICIESADGPLWTSKQEVAFENFLKLPNAALTTVEKEILKSVSQAAQ